jgi:nucleotide-binding universal stress UspA family protein
MMTELRSLLVHMDASPRSLQRLRLAQAMALSPAASGARVTALYGVVPLALQYPASGMVAGAAGAFAMLGDLDAERRDAALQLFERVRGESGAEPVLSWAELGDEALVPAFVTQAMCADALVLGQPDTQDAKAAGVPPDFVPSVLLASGKPALVLPYAGDFTRVGENVLVAWKYSRESARAVASALPLLRGARQVHVTLSNGNDAQALMKPQGGLEIMGWLSAHGVQAQLHHRLVADDAPGESLLSMAFDVDADLLVMGCYGHSRAREWALGGASRTVLGSMTLPVWMAH